MQRTINRIKIGIQDLWYYFNRGLCYVRLRAYRFDEREIKRVVNIALWLQFLVIMKPFAKYNTPELYNKYYFKYEWQFNLWMSLCRFMLRTYMYPAMTKTRARKEIAWFSLNSLTIKK